MPSPVKGVVAALFLLLNTVFWVLLLYVFAAVKLLLPFPRTRAWCSKIMVRLAENWISCNGFEARLMHVINWDVTGVEELDPNRSYLVWSNHQTWVDIVVLQSVFNRKIPFLRFFLKRQLAYVPLLGLAWWALDFPFMRRHSRQYLLKHPEKRGEDLETTRKACERFRGKDISILNFVEGTRFSESKKRSPAPTGDTSVTYSHVLPPKSGGVGFVLQIMGSQFESLLDVTIHYPGKPPSLWDLLSGKVDHVTVRVRRVPIPAEFTKNHFFGEPVGRKQLQDWIGGLWKEKDLELGRLRAARPASINSK